jgi:hypothetical protein
MTVASSRRNGVVRKEHSELGMRSDLKPRSTSPRDSEPL